MQRPSTSSALILTVVVTVVLSVSDAEYSTFHLFCGGCQRSCLDAGDVNDNGHVDLSDLISGLIAVFQSDSHSIPIPPPFPDPGTDPTPDEEIYAIQIAVRYDPEKFVPFMNEDPPLENDLPTKSSVSLPSRSV